MQRATPSRSLPQAVCSLRYAFQTRVISFHPIIAERACALVPEWITINSRLEASGVREWVPISIHDRKFSNRALQYAYIGRPGALPSLGYLDLFFSGAYLHSCPLNVFSHLHVLPPAHRACLLKSSGQTARPLFTGYY